MSCGGGCDEESNNSCGGGSSGGCGDSSSSAASCGGGCGDSSSSASSCGGGSSGGCGGGNSGGCGGGCPPDPKPVCCKPIPPAKPSSGGGGGCPKPSQMEKKVLGAKCKPVSVSETSQVCANGIKGIYVNKCEADKFNGPIPLSQYKINKDPNPQVITKTMSGNTVTQEVSVKFLEPPSSGSAGPIIIREKPGSQPGPAPPLIIRVCGDGKGNSGGNSGGCGGGNSGGCGGGNGGGSGGCDCSDKPGKPQCFRECPPPPCPKICPKLIEICGKPGCPPPRRVIIEKLPCGNTRPGPIYAERWLAPTSCATREVIYEKAQSAGQQKQKNIIIQWKSGGQKVKVSARSLGKSSANPAEYKRKYGSSLVTADQMPDCVKNVKAPGKLAACGSSCPVPKLTGCVKALKLIDLDAHGLSEYKSQVNGGGSGGCGGGC